MSLTCGSNTIWCCCEFSEHWRLQEQEVRKVLSTLSADPIFKATAAGSHSEKEALLCEVKHALQHPLLEPPRFPNEQRVLVLVPEAWKEYDFCEWNGSGHFDMSCYKKPGLPTIAQTVAYVEMMAAACNGTPRLVIHLSSEERRRTGAVLYGSLKVLLHGLSAENAWQDLLLASPTPSTDPALAWDRFIKPFDRVGQTTSTSLSVKDCLFGLQYARDLGWIDIGAHTFDSAEWELLRRKFDLTWVIPGEIIAFAHPCATALNPAFPGLLDPPQALTTKTLNEEISGLGSRVSTKDSTNATHSTYYSPSSCAPSTASTYDPPGSCASSVSLNDWPLCVEDLDLCDDPVAQEGRIIPLKPTGLAMTGFDGSIDNGKIARNFASFFQEEAMSICVRLSHRHEWCRPEFPYDELGIQLLEYPFRDGGVPSKPMVKAFLATCSKARKQGGQRIAVHCMAGLGRTGTLIATHAAAHHGVPGTAWHGWVRMCRPGSIQTDCQEQFVRSLTPVSSKARRFVPKSPSLTTVSGFLKKVASWGSNTSG